MDKPDFWGRVKAAIEEQKTSQDLLAQKCGINRRTLENQIYRNIMPDVVTGQKIAEALNTTVEYLVNGKKNDAKTTIESQQRIF